MSNRVVDPSVSREFAHELCSGFQHANNVQDVVAPLRHVRAAIQRAADRPHAPGINLVSTANTATRSITEATVHDCYAHAGEPLMQQYARNRRSEPAAAAAFKAGLLPTTEATAQYHGLQVFSALIRDANR